MEENQVVKTELPQYERGTLSAMAYYSVAGFIKYSGLVFGVNDLAQGDTANAAIGGVAFVIGTLMDRAVTRRASINELETLEARLKNNQPSV